jgi:hypothetical protein
MHEQFCVILLNTMTAMSKTVQHAQVLRLPPQVMLDFGNPFNAAVQKHQCTTEARKISSIFARILLHRRKWKNQSAVAFANSKDALKPTK